MTNTATVTNLFPSNADRLGEIKAEIKILKDEADKIESFFKAEANGVSTKFEGDLFVANVVVSERDTVDWKAVAAKLEPSHQLVTAHTKHTTVVQVRSQAHGK